MLQPPGLFVGDVHVAMSLPVMSVLVDFSFHLYLCVLLLFFSVALPLPKPYFATKLLLILQGSHLSKCIFFFFYETSDDSILAKLVESLFMHL